MDKLASKIVEAHGGMTQWKKFTKVSAHLKQGGVLWPLKGHATTLEQTNVTVATDREWASHDPFGPDALITSFEADRVTIGDRDGKVLQSVDKPRPTFAGHTLETPWSEVQLAYFAGIAMWTYLNMPFLLAEPGVVTEELGDWSEKGESWHRLKVTFPASIATHSTVQTLYVDDQGLIKRHDYDVEIAGNTPGAHYVGGYAEVQGIMFPTERRIFPRQPDGQSMAEPLVVSIDLSDIRLS